MYTIRKMPAYQDVNNVRLGGGFTPKFLEEAIQYEPRDDDIIILTFPKSGTTWTQYIVHNILTKGKPLTSLKEYNLRCPIIDFFGKEGIELMLRPGTIKTHLPFHVKPYSAKAKYILVIRNPKDCCVSFYHHTKTFPYYQFSEGTFDEYFEIFLNGENDWGDYFDHLLSLYEHRNLPNVLFLVYEEMKADHEATVLNIAKFLGQEYFDMLENDANLLKKILYQTSVEYMRNHVNKHFNGFCHKQNKEETQKDQNFPVHEAIKLLQEYVERVKAPQPKEFPFIRKGVVGDWKNHFSKDQSKRLKAKFDEKTKGTDIPNIWPELFYDVLEN
ncbi:sulfotransferase 1C2A-like [Tachypleus tridentatus]|uniref:sulfotransferase 1C2A-like n=1 Tax=Tachypleus tridentatus TaxID=6853 RepID=UPI003FD64060